MKSYQQHMLEGVVLCATFEIVAYLLQIIVPSISSSPSINSYKSSKKIWIQPYQSMFDYNINYVNRRHDFCTLWDDDDDDDSHNGVSLKVIYTNDWIYIQLLYRYRYRSSFTLYVCRWTCTVVLKVDVKIKCSFHINLNLLAWFYRISKSNNSYSINYTTTYHTYLVIHPSITVIHHLYNSQSIHYYSNHASIKVIHRKFSSFYIPTIAQFTGINYFSWSIGSSLLQ